MTQSDADRLKAGRKSLGLTQAEMGTMFGYNGKNVRQMIWEIESGSKPLMPCQARLLDAYLAGYRPKDWPKARTAKSRTFIQSGFQGEKRNKPNGVFE